MFPPDNFIYFIVLFTLNICSATYLYFAYNRNPILIYNAVGFLFLAARCCTEYYLPSVDSYDLAHQITVYHSFLTVVPTFVLWMSAWLYIRPFKDHSSEKLINRWYVILLGIVHVPLCILLFNRKIFVLHNEKIDGYWQFYTDYSHIWSYLFFITTIFYSIIMVFLFLLDFKRSKEKRIYKIFLIGIFILFPALIYINLSSISHDTIKYTIPNSVVFYTINIIIANWFFTDYRMFGDTSDDIIGDSFNSISDLVIFTETNYLIRQTNVPAKEILHIDGHHNNIISLLSGKSRSLDSEMHSFINELVKHPDKEKEIELIIDEEVKLFTFKVSEYLKGGRLFGYTFFIKDITQQRLNELLIVKKNEELEELNVVKDRLFAIIGHDLKGPINAFSGISKRVNYLLKIKDYDRLDAMSDEIVKGAFVLNNLVSNLMNWALAQRNVLPYQPTDVGLKNAINEIELIFEKRLKQKNITLINSVDSNTSIFVDSNSLNTIFRNIIDNAIKYTKEGGHIEIKTYLISNKVNIQIEDSGVGMSDEQIKDLFVLKKNKSEKGTKGEKGTGLGMHLVHELIELNKGSVDVTSIIGKGTTFNLVFNQKGNNE